jgi:hypothetical protein
MTTEAGKRLAGGLSAYVLPMGMDSYRVHMPELNAAIAAVEVEAVAVERARIADAVRGLPLRGIFGEGPGAEVVGRRRVLEIIEKP